MRKQLHGQGYTDYLKSDDWRCAQSPTGAHHWIIGRPTVCKHCQAIKQSYDGLAGGAGASQG